VRAIVETLWRGLSGSGGNTVSITAKSKTTMSSQAPDLLDALLGSWDRHNRVLSNLLSILPPGGLAAKATTTSPSVSEMFTHLHHERMISGLEEAPEFGGVESEQVAPNERRRPGEPSDVLILRAW
jgi:hypothetical protein